MSELRQNIITRDWVIIASDRANRPSDVAKQTARSKDIPRHDPTCPFCPGNEKMTVHEVLRIPDHGGWRVRVVDNKYPALTTEGERIRKISGIHRSMTGIGWHEVIIEHPRHDLTMARFTPEDVASVLTAYRQRYMEIQKDNRVEAIIIFKNYGERAGTSLIHAHSQLAATPIVPTQIRNRVEEAIRYFDDAGECIFCSTLRDELHARKRIVFESDHFVAFLPYAALSPFHLWIFPRRHQSSYDDVSDDEIRDLALVLRTVLAKLYIGLHDPDYNYSIRSLPTHDGHTDYFHWYVAIIPRVTRTAGFELGSGMYINTVIPEESAEFLRSVQVPESF